MITNRLKESDMSYAHQCAVNSLLEAMYFAQGMGLEVAFALDKALAEILKNARECNERTKKEEQEEQEDGKQTENL